MSWRSLTRAVPVMAVALLSQAAGAQRSVSVRADNDAFNFWQAPWNRPDEEYTSGVRLVLDYAGNARWARRGHEEPTACADALDPCAEHSYTLGQDIYTAVRSRLQPVPLPGARPDAGVLWLSSSNRRATAGRVTDLRWTVGVTGRPALAAPLQRFFHNVAPGWNGPIDWSKQLPAEPVFALSYDQRLLRTTGALELQPHAGASLGNLLTEVRAGLGARAGRSLSSPRRIAAKDRPLTLTVVGDATVRGVARNETLSGTFFRPSVHVALRPVVTELQLGTTLRWRELGVSWIAHQTSAEYRARRGPHAWSALEASWWPRR